MGAKLSRARAKDSSMVMIVRGGGKRETYSRPVSAQEVMLRHPQHVLTHLDVQDPGFRKSIVTAEAVLLPGNKYFLVPRRTVEWLLDQHSSITLGGLSGGYNFSSDHDIETESSKHLNCSFSDILRLTSNDSIIAPTQRFADEQGYLDKGRGKSIKSPLHMSPKSPLRMSPKSPKSPSRMSPKSPLRFTKSFEINRRSSPKVCPGEDYSLWDEQLSDGVGEKHSQEIVHNIMFDRCSPMHPKFSSEEDAVALNQSSNSAIPSNVEMSLQREGNNISSEEGPEKMSLLELLKCPDQQYISTPAQETNEPDIVDISVVEAFEFNDYRAGLMFDDQAKSDALPMKAKGNGVINTNDHCLSTVGESVECHIDLPVVESVLIPCLQQENAQLKKMQAYLSTGTVSLKNVEEDSAGELQRSNQLYCDAKNSEGSPVIEGPQSRDPASLPENGGSIPSRSLLPNILADDLSQDEQREGSLDTLSVSLSQDQPKEGCAYTLVETLYEQRPSNLVILPGVGKSNEPGAKCPLGEKETALQDCDCKGVNVDGSSGNISTKELNTQQVQTLGDIFLRRSPDYLGLIDVGSTSNGMPSLSVAPMSPSVAPLSCLLPSSSFLVSSSSVPVSRTPSSKALLPSPLTSSLLSPSLSGASLSLLMDFDAPTTKNSDPFQSSSQQQQNLRLFGFNSISGDSLSIHAQAKAHIRAHRFMMGKPSKVKMSSTIKQKEECLPPEKVQGQEAWRPSTSQYCGSPLILSSRSIRGKLLRPLKKHPLSPIPELSPEQSPASLSSLSRGPSP